MINSQINILAQAKSYLHAVTTEQYREVVTPLFISSAGQHIRHILDHYVSIMDAIHTGIVDYDKRTRGAPVETDIDVALTLLSEIEIFLLSLTPLQLQQKMRLSTEVSVDKKQVEVVDSSLIREIIFVGSHTIHHFAMIEQISKAQKLSTPAQFGIAPATATFMRGDKCAH